MSHVAETETLQGSETEIVMSVWPNPGAQHTLLAFEEIPDPLDVSTLSRDPSVGEVYNADALVWHGPFKRPTLEALAFSSLEEVVYPEARHEVFNETDRDEVLGKTGEFIDKVTAG